MARVDKMGSTQGDEKMGPSKTEPREIEYLLAQQQDQLNELDKAIAHLTSRLYSVMLQDESDNLCGVEETERNPRTELGNAIRNGTGQIESMNERINYLIRNCELP